MVAYIVLLLFFSAASADQVPYDVLINLGGDCQSAYQMYINGIRKYASPFDTLITPFNALYKILENKFEDFLKKDHLEFIHTDAEKYVADTTYDIRIQHDFPLNENFLSNYDEVKAKYDRRTKRFLEILESSENPLFIRKNITKQQAITLCLLLYVLRAGKNFTLLVLDKTEEMKEAWDQERIINYFLRQTEPYSWKGDNAAWQEIFKAVGLTLSSKKDSVKEI